MIYDAGTDEVEMYLGLGDEERKTVGAGITEVDTSVLFLLFVGLPKACYQLKFNPAQPTYSTPPSGAPRIYTLGTYASPVENRSRNIGS